LAFYVSPFCQSCGACPWASRLLLKHGLFFSALALSFSQESFTEFGHGATACDAQWHANRINHWPFLAMFGVEQNHPI
jgi:hypothetical protein